MRERVCGRERLCVRQRDKEIRRDIFSYLILPAVLISILDLIILSIFYCDFIFLGSFGSLSNLAYGQVLISPRAVKKNKNGFGRYKSSKSGMRKRGRPPKNFARTGSTETVELEIETEIGENGEIGNGENGNENGNGDNDDGYLIGEECVTPRDMDVTNDYNDNDDNENENENNFEEKNKSVALITVNKNENKTKKLDNSVKNLNNEKNDSSVKTVKYESEKTENLKKQSNSIGKQYINFNEKQITHIFKVNIFVTEQIDQSGQRKRHEFERFGGCSFIVQNHIENGTEVRLRFKSGTHFLHQIQISIGLGFRFINKKNFFCVICRYSIE